MHRSSVRARATTVVTAAVLATTGALLVPTSAAAADEPRTSSRYSASCDEYPLDATATGDDPAGLSFADDRVQATVSPADARVSFSSEAVHDAASGLAGESCGVQVSFTDGIEVLPGTSGLAEGDLVEVELHIQVASTVVPAWDADGAFTLLSDVGSTVELTSVDDCSAEADPGQCSEPFAFTHRHVHQITGFPAVSWDLDGYVQISGGRVYRIHDHVAPDVYEEDDENHTLCETWQPCTYDDAVVHPGHEALPVTYTTWAQLEVGRQYELTASLAGTTGASNNDGVSTRTTGELSVTFFPRPGLVVQRASAVQPDTTAPQVSATVSPEPDAGGWHAEAPTVSFAATDDVGVASITYSSAGAVVTPPTTVDGATAQLPIGAEGITEVTYTATDAAGHVSSPQVLTVRYDGTAPSLTGVRNKRIKVETAERVRVFYGYIGAEDAVDPEPMVSCTPASGSFFPVGVSTVTCTAEDAAGNMATEDFTVEIWREPVLLRLWQAIEEPGIPRAAQRALLEDLADAARHFAAGQKWLGCRDLREMDSTVLAYGGKGISPAETATLRGLIGEARQERC